MWIRPTFRLSNKTVNMQFTSDMNVNYMYILQYYVNITLTSKSGDTCTIALQTL